MLTESGFGRGDTLDVYEYDKLIAADERDIDEFIRTYAPLNAQLKYLLAPRDFANARAYIKAQYLGEDVNRMLAPDGLIPASELAACIESGKFPVEKGDIYAAIEACVNEAKAYVETKNVSGAKLGQIFERGLYAYLAKACKGNSFLKKLLGKKADMTNIITAMRCTGEQSAAANYVEGGTLSAQKLSCIFAGFEVAEKQFEGNEYLPFLRKCISAKSKGLPLSEAEKARDEYECSYLHDNRFELRASQPFMYYVFRRRAENANVRIIFACLLGGMEGRAIKSRLRAI
jgi:vacuolar-type H+-ATPase subunit C/Vma6